MASASKSAERSSLTPYGVRTFLRRRLEEVVGITVLMAGLALAIALITFDAADPSFNRASDGPAQNLAGVPGAYVADLLLQTIGLAGTLLTLMFVIWSWRLLTHRDMAPIWLRFTLSPFAITFAATALAALSTPSNWPLGSGLGGLVGTLILDQGSELVVQLGAGIESYVLALASTVLAVALLLPSLAVPAREWRRFGGWLSRLLAGMFRFVIRLGRRDRGFGEAAAELRGALGRAEQRAESGVRLEPHLDGTAVDAPTSAPAAVTGELSGVKLVAPKAGRAKRGKRALKATQASLALSPADSVQLPPLALLQRPGGCGAGPRRGRRCTGPEREAARIGPGGLRHHGEIVQVRPGPVVTLYELEPAPGTKSSRVIGLADDIARSMSAVSARVAVVPGHNVIGIELPNARRETVYLRELLEAQVFERAAGLPLALGKDIGGGPVVVDLGRMPHLLIAGTTGSGKSVAINTMILSLLYRLTPEQCKFILIDPKMLELSVYDDIPHLIAPVVTEPRKAVVALKWCVREMEDRYRAMSQIGVRNVASYNARLAEARKKNEMLMRKVQTGFDSETGKPVFEDQPLDLQPLAFIVVVVDEMADLMLMSGKEIEATVQRLSQMARAAGIHLIMATQRPSVDVITGTIKANFPTRVSFQVTSKIDSRTILAEQGAEQLLGQGDMLYMAGGGRITRVHGPFVSDGEVEEVVSYLRHQAVPSYIEDVLAEAEAEFDTAPGDGPGDELYDHAVALVCRERKASTSFIQRHLQIGYNRAARIIERMEAEGVVSTANHVGKREVLAGDVVAGPR